MTPYQWSTDDDEVALDAIIVGIGSDEKVFTAEGIEFGEVLASPYPATRPLRKSGAILDLRIRRSWKAAMARLRVISAIG